MNPDLVPASAQAAPPASRVSGLLRDLTCGLRQQMYFWGRDVKHPDGNLLLAAGLEKSRSRGLQGTSCYGMAWRGGLLELHGACAGWYGPEGGFVFVRTLDRCHGWRAPEPPVPGEWPVERMEALPPSALRERMLPFLDWWIGYEEGVVAVHGARYREERHREFKRLPRSKPWLPPAAALRWLRSFREQPAGLDRARRYEI